MKQNQDAWNDAVALADRIDLAAKGQPANEVFMALAILLGYTIERVAPSAEDSKAEIEKFVCAVTGVIENLKEPSRHDA